MCDTRDVSRRVILVRETADFENRYSGRPN